MQLTGEWYRPLAETAIHYLAALDGVRMYEMALEGQIDGPMGSPLGQYDDTNDISGWL